MPFMDIGNRNLRNIVLNKFDSHCAYCGCEIDIFTLSIDHVTPKRRKMDNTYHGPCILDNWFPSCKSCNSSKNSMELETWRNEISQKVNRLKRDSSTFRSAFKFGLISETGNNVIFYFEKLRNV